LARTVPEFIAYAKANPGDQHCVAGQWKFRPCRRRTVQDDDWHQYGARAISRRPPAITDLLGGQVQAYFGAAPASIEYIRAGTLRARG
jgi:hypothetical protein